MRGSGKALLGLTLHPTGAKTSNRCQSGGRAGSLKGMRVGAGGWVGWEAWFRWSAPPLGGAVCGSCAQDPAWAPSTSELELDLWPFCILFIIAPTEHACSSF